MGAHRIRYTIIGAGTGDTSYAAYCRACGWSFISHSPTAVSTRGPEHALAAWERERAR